MTDETGGESSVAIENPAKAARAAILEWAKDQSLWKQEALRRVLKAAPADDDARTIAALAKRAQNPEDDLGVKPLSDADFGTLADDGASFSISELRDVVHTNRLAADQTLPFGTTGLTAIYGDNGAGKSGYGRIFKVACSGRDQEPILPDVFADAPAAGLKPVASAKFLILDANGVSEEISWQAGTAPDPRLAAVAVFDSRSAPFYVEKSAFLAFIPYGLDCFERLARLLDAVSEELESEISALAFANQQPLLSDHDNDLVGQVFDSLLKLEFDELDNRLTWEGAKDAALTSLEEAARDPVARVAALNRHATNLSAANLGLSAVLEVCSDTALKAVAETASRARNLRSAANLAASELFSGEPLPGVGAEAWLMLYEAARQYSTERAYPERPFPALDDGDRCVLCQQELDTEGQARLANFDLFVRGETARAAADAEKEIQKLELLFDQTQTAFSKLEIDAECRAESMLEAGIIDDVRSVASTRLAAFQALLKGVQHDDLGSVDPATWDVLSNRSTSLKAAADELDELIATGKAERLASDLKRLEVEKALCSAKPAVQARWKQTMALRVAEAAVAGCATNSVTKKGGELLKQHVSKRLSDAFDKERGALDVTSIEVRLVSTPEKGAVKRTIGLGEKTKAPPPSVLSEGEYRAVALAAFLAEVSTSPGKAPIVVDDPVSSLDHRRRERVANRLAREALDRQVVIFTHDLPFFLMLEAACAAAKAGWKSVYLERGAGGFGAVSSQPAPWDAQKYAQRKHVLSQRLSEIKKHQKLIGEDDAYRLLVTVFYDQARKTWERGLEELVFSDVVVRYRPSLQTLRLKTVPIDDDIYAAFTSGMTTASKITGHDQAVALGGGWPTPADVEDILTSLANFEALVSAKKTAVEAGRKGK